MADHHGQSTFDDLSKLCRINHSYQKGDRFGRLFPDLPALWIDPDALVAIGAPGGPMDAGPNPPKAKTVPVGHVFFGQFIDHDVTLDLTSSIGAVNAPSSISNARTPTLDLDCVYGAGPEAHPYQYHADGPFKGSKLVTAKDMRRGKRRGAKDHDLPRNGQDVAIIGDFRNDENRIVSQIQHGMISVHNKFCDELHAAHGYSGKELYEHARQQTMWHYQWAAVHDFLVAMCGKSVVHRILSEGRQFYTPKVPFIPVEFSVAAYRFGHSMAPLKIVIRHGGPAEDLFGGNLGNGFAPVQGDHEIIEWNKVFFVDGNKTGVQRAERCDPGMAPDLLDLAVLSAEVEAKDRSLAGRNLRRGQSFLLPSGEQVAAAMGHTDAQIKKVTDAAHRASGKILHGATPLWFWLLTEAEVVGRDGTDKCEGLGPVGATIVAEVIIGLLECDGRSWLSSNRDWAPDPDKRTIGDLLNWATGEAIIDLREAALVTA